MTAQEWGLALQVVGSVLVVLGLLATWASWSDTSVARRVRRLPGPWSRPARAPEPSRRHGDAADVPDSSRPAQDATPAEWFAYLEAYVQDVDRRRREDREEAQRALTAESRARAEELAAVTEHLQTEVAAGEQRAWEANLNGLAFAAGGALVTATGLLVAGLSG